MVNYQETLGKTIRVYADGTIERGIEVPHQARNISDPSHHIIASPPPVVRSRRFAPGGIPAGVNQHLPCTIEAHRDATLSRSREDAPKCPECRAIDADVTVIL